jgi:hypothetical protein
MKDGKLAARSAGRADHDLLQENPYEPDLATDPVRLAKIHSEIGVVGWLLIVQDKVISVVEVFAKVGGAKRSPLLK